MYIALRTMKVQNDDGTYRMVQPGDPVPEAAGWKNLRVYVNTRRVALAPTEAHGTPKADSDAELHREAEAMRNMSRAEAPVVVDPEQAYVPTPEEIEEDLHGFPPGFPGGADEEESAAADVDDDPEHGEASEAGSDDYTRADLSKMLKSDLQILADALSINVDQTKAELVEAILEAQ
jgi:hypothetical protein